jgi:hypothetical protein
MDKYYALMCLEKLTGWAKRRGYKVCFKQDNEDEILFDDKKINITTRTTYENRVYSLLHECGHLIEYANGGLKYHRKYPLAWRSNLDGRVTNSIQGRIELIEEEINAWRQGEKLAKRLGLYINKSRYNKYASYNLIRYIDWAAERGPKSPKNNRKKVVDNLPEI